jgi:hypothetical protein
MSAPASHPPISRTAAVTPPRLNRFISQLLRSPLHSLLDRWLLLLTVYGRRTGRAYTLPVQYARRGDAIDVLPGTAARKTWWRNLRGGAPVVLHLGGRDYVGTGDVLTGEAATRALAGTSLALMARAEPAPILVTIRDIEPKDGSRLRPPGSVHAGEASGHRCGAEEERPWSDGPGESWVVRSPTYRRLRSWIITHQLAGFSIAVIKLMHTVIFVLLLGCVLHVTYAAFRGQLTQGTRRSLLAIGAEALVFGLSGRRCPLTVVVEDLGAEHGQVTDLFLPDRVARHIFTISASLLGIGAAAAAQRRRSYAAP